MELLPATASTRDVYQLCTTHAELLRHTAHPAVQRVAHALRSFKHRHKHLLWGVAPTSSIGLHPVLNACMQSAMRHTGTASRRS